MSNIDIEITNWRKASSSGSGGNCVEVGSSATHVGVRDTKDREAGHIAVPFARWSAFLAGVKAGEFDLS
ncbi:DUF397 domain-containing protein [Actinopolymorpha pittospori]